MKLFCSVTTDEKSEDQEAKGSAPLFSRNEKIFLAIASPLWVPIVTAASILFLPVGVGMLIKETLKARRQRQEYMNDKVRFMRKWTVEIMSKCLTKENIQAFIFHSYLASFQESIKELCNDYIPKQIAADKRQVNDIANDRRTSQEILRAFKPLQKGIREILANVMFFELQFIAKDVIRIDSLRRIGWLGNGSFSDVHLAAWQRDSDTLEVALKVLKSKLVGAEMYSQLSEVQCLR